MKKYYGSLLAVGVLFGCNNNKPQPNKITIKEVDSLKVVQIEVIRKDTFQRVVEDTISNEDILLETKQFTDSIDNLRAKEKDSLRRENFKKLTRKINGGYNGLADRERLWERAKQILEVK